MSKFKAMMGEPIDPKRQRIGFVDFRPIDGTLSGLIRALESYEWTDDIQILVQQRTGGARMLSGKVIVHGVDELIMNVVENGDIDSEMTVGVLRSMETSLGGGRMTRVWLPHESSHRPIVGIMPRQPNHFVPYLELGEP